MIEIVFFASIREALDRDRAQHPVDQPLHLSELITQLTAIHGAAWHEVLTAENVKIAVNQELVSDDMLVSDGDEVAFFPPVTGG